MNHPQILGLVNSSDFSDELKSILNVESKRSVSVLDADKSLIQTNGIKDVLRFIEFNNESNESKM